ncbi:hypothetical protein P4L25_33330, partial [Bacillus cereus]|nr:hypothetical protein [Bacillus cereus]
FVPAKFVDKLVGSIEKERIEMKKVFKLLEYPLVFSLIITIVFGILIMYSASSIVAVENYGYSSFLLLIRGNL